MISRFLWELRYELEVWERKPLVTLEKSIFSGGPSYRVKKSKVMKVSTHDSQSLTKAKHKVVREEDEVGSRKAFFFSFFKRQVTLDQA